MGRRVEDETIVFGCAFEPNPAYPLLDIELRRAERTRTSCLPQLLTTLDRFR